MGKLLHLQFHNQRFIVVECFIKFTTSTTWNTYHIAYFGKMSGSSFSMTHPMSRTAFSPFQMKLGSSRFIKIMLAHPSSHRKACALALYSLRFIRICLAWIICIHLAKINMLFDCFCLDPKHHQFHGFSSCESGVYCQSCHFCC